MKRILKFIGCLALMAFAGTGAYCAEPTLTVNHAWAGKPAGEVVEGGGVIGTTAFDTIQKAVAKANVSEGAVTINVMEGTYTETVQFYFNDWPNGNKPYPGLKFNDGTQDWYGRLRFNAKGKVILNGQFSLTGNDQVQYLNDIEIVGFTFDNQLYPVYLLNSAGESRNILIKNNTIAFSTPSKGASSYGPVYVNSAKVKNVTVTGNKISGATNISMDFSGLGGKLDNVIVTDNVLTGCNNIGFYGQVLEGGVTVSGNKFDGCTCGVFSNNNMADSTGAFTISDNQFVNGIDVVIRFSNNTKKSDFIIGTGNTVGGVGVVGWADAANEAVVIDPNAGAKKAVYFDTKLYLGDETAFTTAEKAVAGRTEPVTILNYDPSMQPPKDWKFVTEGGVTKLVKKVYVAKIGDDGYETLKEALDAAVDNDVITLVADATEADLSYNNGYTPNPNPKQHITINLNGKTFKLNSFFASYVVEDSFTTISNGVIDVTGAVGKGPNGDQWPKAVFFAQCYNTLTFDGVHFVGTPADGNNAIFNICTGGGEIAFEECDFNFGSIQLFADGHVGRYFFKDTTVDLTGTTVTGGIFKDDTGVGLNIVFDNSTLKANGAPYSFWHVSASLDNGSHVELVDVKDCGLTGGDLELANGSKFVVNKCSSHGFTNSKLTVGDGCELFIKDAAYLGANCKDGSIFAAGSKVVITGSCRASDLASYKDKHTDLRVNDGTLTIEKGANVDIADNVRLMAGTTIRIADGKYGAVIPNDDGVACTGDLTGGIYKVKPDDAFVNKKALAVDNDDEATKDEYPYMVYRLPDVAQVGDEKFVSIEDAYAAVPDGGTIKLLTDAELTVALKCTKAYTLDLDGKKLTIGEGGGIGINNDRNTGGKVVVFKNGDVTFGPKCGCTGGTLADEHGWLLAVFLQKLCTLTFENVNVVCDNCTAANVFYVNYNSVALNFIGGTFKSTGCADKVIYSSGNLNTINFTGTEITHTGSAWFFNGEAGAARWPVVVMTLSDCDVTCTSGRLFANGGVKLVDGTTVEAGNVQVGNGAEISLSGGSSIKADGSSYTVFSKARLLVGSGCSVTTENGTGSVALADGTSLKAGSTVALDVPVTVTGNATVEAGADVTVGDALTANGSGTLAIAAGRYVSVGRSAETESIVLTGGIYDEEPDDAFIAPCYKKTKLTEYDPVKWLVELDGDQCPAKIVHADGSATYYKTFAEAVDAATPGGTISVNREIAQGEDVEIADKELTLDLAGQVINSNISFSGAGEDFIIDSVGGGKVLGTITVDEGCTLKIRAGLYAFDPSKEPTKWLDPAVDETGRALYVVVPQEDGIYKVMPNQIEVKEPDPKDVAMTDENGNQIPPSEMAEAAAAIVEANTEIKQTIQQNSSIDTGIEGAAKEPVVTPSGEIVPGPAKQGVVKALQAEAPEQAKGQITAQSDISSRLVIDIKQEIATIRTVATTEGPKKDAVLTTILYKVEPFVKTVVTVTDGTGGETTEEVEAPLPNEELKKNPLTFRLGIKDPNATGAYVRHIGHDEFEDETIFCKVQGPAGGRYVELTVDHFSDFEVRTVDAVIVDTDDAVGIVNLGVPVAGKELAAAVPFLKSGVSGFETAPKATLADLVVTGRENGDKILFQKTGDESALSGDVWGDDAAQETGTAFWYKSVGSSVPLTLAGLVTDTVETEVTAGSAAEPKATLLVNPYVSAQDIFAAVGDAAQDGDQVALVGGDVRYVREDGAWGYWKKSEYRANPEVTDGGLFMSNEFVRVSSLSVPGGKGAWYVSKGGNPTVAWTAGVQTGAAEQIADADLPTFGLVAWDVSLTGADMDAFAPEKVNLVAYDADGAKVGDYARPLVVDALGQHWTTFLGQDGYGWADKDVTAAQFAVELLDAAENVIASTEKVGFGDLLAENALDVTYAGDKTPAVVTDLHMFAGFSVSDNGEFASLTNAFAGFAKVRKTAGGYVVTLTNDMEGVVTIADNLGAVTLDLNGCSIKGTNGVAGAGGVALAVTDHIIPGGDLTALLVTDSKRTQDPEKGILGGDGALAANGFDGGAAIVIADGVTVTLETGDKKPNVKGGQGGIGHNEYAGRGGYAVAKASDGSEVPGIGEAGQDGQYKKAWAWCTCTAPTAPIAGTYHDGSKLWIYERNGNFETGVAEFDFGLLKDLEVAGNAIHFVGGDTSVGTLKVGTDAFGGIAFLGADERTVLVAAGGSMFDVSRGDVQTAVWSNITFTADENDFADAYTQFGGAIWQRGGALEVSGCVFTNLVAADGGAIGAEFLSGNSLIVDSVFAQNGSESIGDGGAVCATAKEGAQATLSIVGSEFSGNSANRGGAVSVAAGYIGDAPIGLVVVDTLFEGNRAYSGGGAIDGNPATLLVDAGATKDDPGTTAFVDNWSFWMGGAVCIESWDDADRTTVGMGRGVRFVGNAVSNDTDTAVGGAFDCELHGGCVFAAEGVEFTDNLAYSKWESFGGALSFLTNCAVTVDTCVFDGNLAVCEDPTIMDEFGGCLFEGGAIDAQYGSAAIRNSTFRNSNVEAVALIGGTAAVTNCVAVGNGGTIEGVDYPDLGFYLGTEVSVAYSAYGTADGYENLDDDLNLTNRTTEIYAGDTLRLNPVGFNPVAALGIKQDAYDFVGVKYGSKAYGSSMGAYETPTERLYVNLDGDKIYDGMTDSNNVYRWTWTFTDERGANATWTDLIPADAVVQTAFGGLFTVTNWVYGCKDHGFYATTNAAPRDLDAQIMSENVFAQWCLDSGILKFVGTGTIDRRPVEMGGLEFTIDPAEYAWNNDEPVDATVIVKEKIELGEETYSPELTLVEGTDYHLTCSENTRYTAEALATADLLHNWIGTTNGTYWITAYLVETYHDGVLAASKAIGKVSVNPDGTTNFVSVVDTEGEIAQTKIVSGTQFAFDHDNSPTNGLVRRVDHADGILRLQVMYYTDEMPKDGTPDIYQRRILAKVVNGAWGAANEAGYKDDQTYWLTMTNSVGRWTRSGSGAIDVPASGLVAAGNHELSGFSAGGWLALTSEGLKIVNPQTFTFSSGTVPFLIYAYSHGVTSGGTGRTGRTGRTGGTTGGTALPLTEQYGAILNIADASFSTADGKIVLKTKAVVSGNGTDINLPMGGTKLKVYATEALGKPWSAIEATADAEGNVMVDLSGDALNSCFFKVGL